MKVMFLMYYLEKKSYGNKSKGENLDL
jgi:hypothetical protein